MFSIFVYTLLIQLDLHFMLCGNETYTNVNVMRNILYMYIRIKNSFSKFGMLFCITAIIF